MNPTLSVTELERILRMARAASLERSTPKPSLVTRAERNGPLPLSFAQQRLWFLDQLGSGGSAYHIPAGLRLRGTLDRGALVGALDRIVARHEALRTVFAQVDGVPEQRISPAEASGFRLAEHDLGTEADAAAELDRIMVEEARAPFDLERGPLVRGRLVRLAEDDHVLLLTMHHIVSDGWSMGVLFGELSALYGAFHRGEPDPLPPLPVQYADYAVWQRRWVTGEVLQQQAEFWKRTLAGAPELLELPTDHPRPAQQDHAGAALRVELDEALAAGLRALSARHGTTLFTTLLAGWAIVLGRLSGQDDVVVGTPSANRGRAEIEGLIGFFVNTLALRVDLSGSPSVAELLGRLKARSLAAQQHQDIPFEQVVEGVQPVRSLSHSPLFQVMFAWQNTARESRELPGLRVGPAGAAPRATAKFDLSLTLQEAGDRITGDVEYATALFERATVERHLGWLRRVLGAMAEDERQAVDRLPLLSRAERRQVVEEWSGGGGQAPSARPVHELFAEQAARAPDAVALAFGSESVTYAELDRRSDALARRLAALGVGPEARVGICVERSPEMVAGLLAVLKAGGAYVPLDPAYPAERLAFMLADSGARILLTQERLRDRIPELGVERVVLDGEVPGHGDAPLPADVSPEGLACVIYTSGSTGQPKGTGVPHRAIPGFFRGADYARFDAGTVTLQHSSVSWDALTLELWPALLSGGTCVLYPGRTSEPAVLGEQVWRHGVNTLWLTAAYFNLVVDTSPEVLSGVAQVMIGGEAASAPHVRRALELHPGLRLVNGYGPSECTVFASCWPVPAGFDAPAVPIGRPVGDRRVYLLDRGFEPVPVGVPGELFVGGPGVARGYLGRPELTAEAFVPDSFGEPGARLYRTGDRVRWRADGVLEFVGRVDFQAKIRGFRVEPGEVEAVLAAHPEVREAAVVVREAAPGERRLVAFATAEEGAKLVPAGVRAYLAERMPDHMVPAAVVVLDAMPLTPNGKVDRRALPAPDPGGAQEPVAPRTPTEEVVAGIFAGVLGSGRVGAHDDFFELGGHSLLATRVVSRVREVFGVELPLRALFEGPTVAEMAVRVEEVRRAGAPSLPPVVPTARTGALPLSFAQERLWFIDRLEPGSAAYNIPVAQRLGGALDGAALERALGEIVRRHEALRTVFAEAGGSPVQVIAPFAGFALPVEDLTDLSEADREGVVGRRAGEEVRRAFDLAAGPLFRASLLRVGAEEHVLLLSMHHIVSDGWSMGVLFGELSALYAAYREGRPSPLPELPVQYADYALWQRAHLSDETLERQLAYWRERLADAPALLELPTDRPRPPVPASEGSHESVELPGELLARLRALGRREGATLYMTLLAASQALLSRYAGSEDVVVGSPIAGRIRGETEGLIGFFVNTLVLRTDLFGDPGFREALRRVREVTLGAYEHQELPFEKLVAELQPDRILGHTPLFQVIFSLASQLEAAAAPLAGLRVEPVEAEIPTVKFDLSMDFAEHPDGLRAEMRYRTELFERGTVTRMLGHLRRVLEQVAADGDPRLSALELLDGAEREQVLAAWNRTARPYPDTPLHALFAGWARRAPEATAVAFRGETVTYGELDRRAGAIARRLRAAGVGPEVRVGILAEPGPALVAGVLGILQAGGAYLPLDPAYPAERLAFMLDDAGAPVVLAQPELLASLPPVGARVVPLTAEADAAEPSHDRASEPSHSPSPEGLAYVIYTSGSTGTPKGVLVEHRGLCNLVHHSAAELGIGPGDATLCMSSVAFDVWVYQALVPLATGGAVRMVPREQAMDPPALVEALEEATALYAVPSLMRQLAAAVRAAHPAGLPGMRLVVAGGDVVGAGLRAELREAFPNADVWVAYGPTEATVACSSHRVGEGGTGRNLIGRPYSNTAMYVVDAAGEPVPVGVPGELWIGGAGVARGYLGRPAPTAAAFVPDAFGGVAGGRLYRSGDRVRWTSEGELEFLGRIDAQVKVRGFRVEPGEIEAAVRRHPGVRECAVVAREEGGDRQLVAYVAGGVDVSALRERLRAGLPAHMVPAAIVVLETLPLTLSGKLDHRALPAPDFASAEGRYVAPRTPTEKVLADIWAETLRLERVGVTASFLELGGHSLLATRMVSRVRQVFGVEVPLRAFFKGPTVAGLAGRVEEIRRAGAPALPPVVPAGRTRPLPLSFAQERLWLVDRMEPGSTVYNLPVAWRLGGTLDEAALERALGEIVRRHEALRTTFAEVDGSPVQVIAPFGAFALPTENLSELDEADREAALGQRVREEAARPFDLAAGPLFRARLLRLGAEDHVLLLSMHHVVSDGWSMEVLSRELSALYAAYREGGESPLPEPGVQYADYAVWQREQLAGETLDRQLAYWRKRLAGAPELLELPTDHPRPAVQTYRGATVPMEFSRELLERLQALERTEGATLFMVLLGAFQVLLSRYSGGEDIVVGSPIAGRTRGEVEGLIGFFVNTLVLRVDLSGDPSFRELLGRVREVTLGAYEHQDMPFERLVGELSPERSLSRSPLFQVSFTLGGAQDTGGGLAGLGVREVAAELQVAKFDLSLGLAATARGLRGELNYSTDLFEPDTVRRMVRHLERVLEQVAWDADLRLSELKLAGEEERQALLAAGHATRSFPVAERLDQRFEARALERPDAPALTFEGSTLTYRELNERANRLAHRLRALGVAPGTRVGIALERSAELVAAILAVLKAGAAYVPLDPAYPAERIAFVLEDAGVPVLVTASHLAPRLPAFSGAMLHVDTDPDAITRESSESPGVEAGPDTLAYVIYTSGSTGKPKGVQVTHANVVRLFDATDPWFGFAADDVWTLFHSCAFDFSVWEIWGALLHGGRLVVVPFLTTRSPEDFHRLLAAEGVTMLSQTPSAFKQLVQADLASGVHPSALRLRHVVFGGEALDPQALRPWMERHGDRRPRLVNMYGITETTVHVTYRVITRADLDRAGSPIGVPIPDLALYVLDSRLEPVPIGVPGEIFVGGAGVARGYLNRPELTAKRFLHDPFSADPAARLYRSGDLARWRADGELEYLGRADQQVKVRGFRIEPGEVEAALRELPGVRDAAVLVREDARGDKQLVAYVVLHAGEAEDPTALRAALSGRLPEYMVPAVFVVLPEMPLTANGKLDRRALPAPEAGRTLRPAYASPASAAERLLQEVWQEVLGVERVGVLENFFAAGGDSMRAVQMVAALRKRGMELAVRDLFEQPTIRGLAQRTDAASRADAAPETGVPHHLADLPEEEWAHVRAVFPAPFQDVYPATGMQAVMLAEYAKDTARTGVYHPQQCHRLTDPALSTDALRHAIGQVVRRHAIFRTVFATGRDGALLQVVRESACVPIGYRDLRGLSPDERERAVRSGVAEDLATPFDPFDPGGSLIRFVIFHREDHVADLLVSAHHAIEDGWGNVHFLGTLFQAYADARDGRPVSAAPAPNAYREFVALEAEILASDEARSFWRDRMRHVSSPWPAPRAGAGGSPRESLVVREAAPELTAALRETAAREGVALKALYLSPFLDVVATLTGGEEACAGVVWNGRSERLSDPLTALGLFWNLVPVARPATASGGAAGRVLAVHRDLLQADLFGRYPLAEIVADRAGREPFFSTFNFLHFRNWAKRDATTGARVEPVYGLDRLHLPFNLAVSLAPSGEGATLLVEYDGRYFGRVDVEAALESYLLRLGELT